ncbi:MAG: DUF4920 domain-containing protein [Gammaproteobacteria bacterium]|nr:DUF4920 domain-containing protein [Gammaproteobacteria bacterium]
MTFVACAMAALGAMASSAADTGFGEPLSDATAVSLSELSANPNAYVGQTVKVVGLVEDVCPMKGCWVDILDRQSSATIRLKVQDDVIVFPAEAKGQEIVAEGTLRRLDLSPRQAVAWLRHAAEERGETFVEPADPAPLTVYQIEGRGAVVSGLAAGSSRSD